jgi:hypothetical protein
MVAGVISYHDITATVIFDEVAAKSVKTMTEKEVLDLLAAKNGYVYSGDHRRQAVQTLHRMYPQNMNFRYLRTSICILPSEEKFKVHLYTLGLTANLLGEIRKSVSWGDRLIQQHRLYVEDVSDF